MANIKDKIELVRNYFRQRPEVLMAFVFGSYATGRQTSASDFDIAVYFRDSEKTDYSNEDQIRLEVADILHKNIDLVCLNGAPASLVSDVLKTGIPLLIRDRKLYWTLYLKVSLEAEDFWLRPGLYENLSKCEIAGSRTKDQAFSKVAIPGG